jgi:hypothetical protein
MIIIIIIIIQYPQIPTARCSTAARVYVQPVVRRTQPQFHFAWAGSNTQAARSLHPAVEVRSCAGSDRRGAVSASGPGGQIWCGDLAPGPDASIWPLRRDLTQDLAGGARC